MTDAIVAANQFVDIESAALTPVVQIAPMPPGRSYLVWATGHVAISHALVGIELEAFGAKDWIALADGGGGLTSYAFSLTVGTTLPPDEDLFTVAKLSAQIRDVLSSNPQDTANVSVTARLVLLAVDTLTVQGEQVSAL